MLDGLLLGLQTAFSLQNLFMVIGGCLIGTFIGMLPGLGPMSIIAIMIPVTISIGDPLLARTTPQNCYCWSVSAFVQRLLNLPTTHWLHCSLVSY